MELENKTTRKRNSKTSQNKVDISQLKLIDGIYNPIEGKEILINLFSHKINFLKIKNWSSNERLGKPDENALLRIEQLQICVRKISELIETAKIENKKLAICSDVSIRLIDN
ncbi:MAG TPA: hypothetical protein PK323_13185 [Bacteroidia bacterium]|nr:hypothetical protein [Bacteroidia bacterium]